MTTAWTRLTARIGALRHHRVVMAVSEGVRQWVGKPMRRRIVGAIARVYPRDMARRSRLLFARLPIHVCVVLPILLLVVLVLSWFVRDVVREQPPGEKSLPDLASIEDIPQRKQAFIEFLRPVIEHENERILEQRARLLDILERLEEGKGISVSERAWLEEKAERYRAKGDDALELARRLRERIDIIPVSLALAQAAMESGWGTSRFARKGNNLFGQWCFESGCGIVPEARPDHARYEVETFATVGEAVRSYMRNLNSHPAYGPVRRMRAAARREGRRPTGMEMAAGLINYAAIGETYVEHIRTIIRRNDLQRLAQSN